MGKIDFNIGEFDTCVMLYKQQIIRTETGAVEKSFELMRSVFAKVNYKTLGEDADANQIQVVECLELVTYLLADMDNSWRVEIGKTMYEVISVEPIKRRFMKIVAKKI